jgi:hypothetical protein
MKAEYAGFTVLLCPFCETQVGNDQRKPRKRRTGTQASLPADAEIQGTPPSLPTHGEV